MNKRALFGLSKLFLIIIIFIIIGVIIAIFKWPVISQVVNKITNSSEESSQVIITTSKGEIVIELYPDKAPITVENFLNYVKSKHYDNTIFHRVIRGFMIQGGGYTADGKQKPVNAPIKLESNNGLKNEIYSIAMARTSVPDSATSQFFINTADNEFLNYGVRDEGYAVFGKVIKGMDVVDKIEQAKTSSDKPLEDIIIIDAEIN